MKTIQCIYIKPNGKQCGNKRNVHPLTLADEFTCEKHGGHQRLQEVATKVQAVLNQGIPGVFPASELPLEYPPMDDIKKAKIIATFNKIKSTHVRVLMKRQFVKKFGEMDTWTNNQLQNMDSWIKRYIKHLIK